MAKEYAVAQAACGRDGRGGGARSGHVDGPRRAAAVLPHADGLIGGAGGDLVGREDAERGDRAVVAGEMPHVAAVVVPDDGRVVDRAAGEQARRERLNVGHHVLVADERQNEQAKFDVPNLHIYV